MCENMISLSFLRQKSSILGHFPWVEEEGAGVGEGEGGKQGERNRPSFNTGIVFRLVNSDIAQPIFR